MSDREKYERDQLERERTQGLRCRCGSSKFDVIFQAWVETTFEVQAGALVSVAPVSVNAAEMNSDWITVVSCAECGLQIDPQQDGALHEPDSIEDIGDVITGNVFDRVAELASEFDYSTLGVQW